MIRFAASRVGGEYVDSASQGGAAHLAGDEDGTLDARQRLLVLAAHLAAINRAPASVQSAPEALTVWLQELYCRAYALQVVASNLSGWRPVGPDGRALHLGRGKDVVAAAKLLLLHQYPGRHRDHAHDQAKPKRKEKPAEAEPVKGGPQPPQQQQQPQAARQKPKQQKRPLREEPEEEQGQEQEEPLRAGKSGRGAAVAAETAAGAKIQRKKAAAAQQQQQQEQQQQQRPEDRVVKKRKGAVGASPGGTALDGGAAATRQASAAGMKGGASDGAPKGAQALHKKKNKAKRAAAAEPAPLPVMATEHKPGGKKSGVKADAEVLPVRESKAAAVAAEKPARPGKLGRATTGGAAQGAEAAIRGAGKQGKPSKRPKNK